MEEFEHHGIWWIPEQSDKKVSGTLRFYPADNASLDLIGSFKDVTELNIFQQPNIILGLTSDGKKVTLHKCYESKSSLSMPGFLKTSFVVSVVFIGHHFERKEDIIFDSLSLNYSNLDEWAGISGFHQKLDTNSEGHLSRAEINYSYPQKVEAQLKDFRISLNYQFTMSGAFSEFKLKQTTFLKIETHKPTHFDDYMDMCYHVQNFLSLAEGKAVYPLSIKAKARGCQTTLSDGKVVYNDIFIFYPIRDSSKSVKQLSRYDMLFSFQDISADFEKCFKNWFAKSETLKPVYDLYFGTLYNSSMYLHHEFLSLVQAMETYHRRTHDGKYLPDEDYLKETYPALINAIPQTVSASFRESLKRKLIYLNEFSLRKRLEEILESCGELTNPLINNKVEFIEDVVNTRNYLTHFDKELEAKAKTGEDLYKLAQKMRFILEVCLLKELGIADTTIGDLISRNQKYQHLRHNLLGS
jgi:hypothetical protein